MKTIPLVIRGAMPPPISYNDVISGLKYLYNSKRPDCVSIFIKEVEIIHDGMLIRYANGQSVPVMISCCEDEKPSLWVAHIDYCAKDEAAAKDIVDNPFFCPDVGIHSSES